MVSAQDRSDREKKANLDPETWVEEHGDYLFRYAMVRVRNAGIAEEVVQETLLAALQGRSQFKGRSSERTWLVGILRHKIMDYFRKNSREASMGDLASSEPLTEDPFAVNGKWKIKPASWGGDPKDALEKKEFWQTFEECMTSLPLRLAHVFALREFEDLKSDEICNLLKISTTNLNVALYRARLRLARCLEINWFGKEGGRKP